MISITLVIMIVHIIDDIIDDLNYSNLVNIIDDIIDDKFND